MLSQETQLQKCLADIEVRLDWGPSLTWTNHDFEELSDRVATITGVSLSVTTLKRVWGRITYDSQPSATTLDTLARFAGHGGWRDYRTEVEETEENEPAVVPASPSSSHQQLTTSYWYFAIPAIIILTIVLLIRISSAPPSLASVVLNPEDYTFDLHAVASGVPNSVIFTYEASAAPSKEIYLQQNWDSRRRERLSAEGSTHTSIYYLPGYYQAKLVVEDQIIHERELLINSQGWVAAVDADPIPIYLPLNEVHRDEQLTITKTAIEDMGVDLQPTTPTTVLTNVGMLKGLYSNDFYFQTRLRHDYAVGTAACQKASILLLLKTSVIIIPLSALGCVADLELVGGGQSVSGHNTDLSAFGVVSDQWIEVACTGNDRLLIFCIDGKEVYRLQSKENPLEIVGVRYLFDGPGSVDEVAFGNHTGEVWKEKF